jgi:hypothetical protein
MNSQENPKLRFEVTLEQLEFFKPTFNFIMNNLIDKYSVALFPQSSTVFRHFLNIEFCEKIIFPEFKRLLGFDLGETCLGECLVGIEETCVEDYRRGLISFIDFFYIIKGVYKNYGTILEEDYPQQKKKHDKNKEA